MGLRCLQREKVLEDEWVCINFTLAGLFDAGLGSRCKFYAVILKQSYDHIAASTKVVAPWCLQDRIRLTDNQCSLIRHPSYPSISPLFSCMHWKDWGRILFSHFFELITMLILYVRTVHLYIIIIFPCSHVGLLLLWGKLDNLSCTHTRLCSLLELCPALSRPTVWTTDCLWADTQPQNHPHPLTSWSTA